MRISALEMLPVWSTINTIQRRLRQIEDIQEQLDLSWDMDHAEHLLIKEHMAVLERTVASLGMLQMAVLERDRAASLGMAKRTALLERTVVSLGVLTLVMLAERLCGYLL